jgi:arylsulfatase A-like enzyme
MIYQLARAAVIAVTLAASIAPSVGRAESDPKFNVLFIICDDLNCDLGSYGHPQVKSPNIDRLAERGLRFERAYCQYPLCGPSRASFMTGLYSDQTLIRANAIRLRERLPDVQSLSQMFRRNGYTATRVGKIYHYNVPADIGNDGHDDPQSWDRKINPRGRDKAEESKIFSLLPGSFGGTLSWLAADGTGAEQTDGIGAAEAIKVLEEHAKDSSPFFLAVGFYRPHTPYVAPKQYFDLYPTGGITVPSVPEGYHGTLPAPARGTITAKKDQVNLADHLARQAIQAYHASITFADAQVGHVLDALDRLGLAENTIVVFTSDHGYHMGEHGHWQKMTLFENAARVPLIIAVPGMKTAGRSTASLAEMTDFYPTLAELCGLKPPDNLSGVSLRPVMDDPSATPRTSALTQHTTGYSIRTDRYRYTEWGPDGRNGNELYDHQSDPQEMVNLAGSPESAGLVRELSKLLRQRAHDAQRVPEGLKQIQPSPNKPKRKNP